MMRENDVTENRSRGLARLMVAAVGAASFLAAGAGVLRSSLVRDAIALEWRPVLTVLLVAFPFAGWVVADRIGQLCDIASASRATAFLRKTVLVTVLVILGGMGLLVRPAHDLRHALDGAIEQPRPHGIPSADSNVATPIESADDERERHNLLQAPEPLVERDLPRSAVDERLRHLGPQNRSGPSPPSAFVPGSLPPSLNDHNGDVAEVPGDAVSCAVAGNGKIVKWVDTSGVTHYAAGARCPSGVGSNAVSAASLESSCTVVGGGRMLKWVDPNGVTRYSEGVRCPEPRN